MADSAWFRGEGGGLHLFDLPLPAEYAEQERQGRLTRVNEDGSSWTGDSQPEPEPEPAEDEPADESEVPEVDDEDEAAPNVQKPKQVENKAAWVAWAVLVSDLSEDEANAMTKAELIEQFG